MRELSLYYQLLTERHEQVLGVLAGFTGMQPVNYSEQRLIHAQKKIQVEATDKKKMTQQPQQRVDLLHQKLYRDISNHSSPSPWQVRIEAVPDPGKTVISRVVQDREATQTDLTNLQDPELYRQVDIQYVEGQYFVHGNVIIRLWRFLVPDNREIPQDPIGTPPPDLRDKDFKLLDTSGAYIVEAVIRVSTDKDDNVPALLTRAQSELEAFAQNMKGCANFYCPDRLVFDTRVKDG